MLNPVSRGYRLSDALNGQAASLQTTNTTITGLQASIGTLQSQVATLQGQMATLQAQVAAQQLVINSFNYGQFEVSTGTLFLDQRTIYKRSFVINGALNTALNVFTYPHGIANINYIVAVTAMAAQAQGQQLPITFINMATAPNISLGVSCWCDTTNIFIACGSVTFANYQVLATLWYTATDR